MVPFWVGRLSLSMAGQVLLIPLALAAYNLYHSGYPESMEMSTIAVGQELDEARFTLDASLVRDYIAVVDDRSNLYQGADLVPPTAVAALGVRTLLDRLALPPGTIHIAQELAAHRTATCGQRVSCQARVAQSSQRRDGRFLVLEFTVADERGQPVLDGRTTLVVPGQEG